MNFGTLLPRIVTGLAVLALLGLALYFGHTWMIALAFVCAVLGLWEFYSLFWPGRTHLADKLTGMGLAVIVFAGSWLQHAALWGGAIDSLIAATAVCFLIVAIVFLIRYGTGRGAARLDDAALTLFGVLYVPIPIALALLLPRVQVLLLLAVVASADTCAYFAGNLWGKRRIWPRISPKKSV
ncbi:MAG: phosphatidate cytidylyltransferase, partial [Deltaproteobacteria bacterium]|nr:phosphatidate cytidylyltransferase [Deltaproteobacteria bacterium]